MTEIIRQGNPKQEDAYLIPFLTNFYGKRHAKIEFIALERPDYFIKQLNTYVEVKEIHDSESNKSHAIWGKIVNKISSEVYSNPKYKQVRGTYLVNVPENIKTPTEQTYFAKEADSILNSILENKLGAKISSLSITISKINNSGSYVGFGNIGKGGSIDPSNIVYKNIKPCFKKANTQLGYKWHEKNGKKILLLVNKYYFPLWDWDLFNSIANTYKDLREYENIEEIWYLLPKENNEYECKLLYGKELFKELENKSFTEITSNNALLLSRWFAPLLKVSASYEEKLLYALKYILKYKHPFDVFTDNYPLEEIARFGNVLIGKGQYEEAIWLIEKFLNKYPKRANANKGELSVLRELNFDIKRNEEVNNITTVFGHLAWVIQKLSCNTKYIEEALNFTVKLLKKQNPYLILQSIYPLIEISSRRNSTDIENRKQLEDEILKIAVTLTKKYSRYKAIANLLVQVFFNFKSLDSEKARVILRRLENGRNVTSLYIYFAVYRPSHFIEKGTFNNRPFINRLNYFIKSEKVQPDIKEELLWQMWRILADNPKEMVNLEPFIVKYLDLPFKQRYLYTVERIIELIPNHDIDKSLQWYTALLKNAGTLLLKKDTVTGSIWFESEDILKDIAKNRPYKLVALVKELVNLWELGAFIGDPVEIFNVYQLIDDKNIKLEVCKEFEVLYRKMKNINPKIKEMSFD
ncbi:MAG: hypothetical protein ACD_22C00206G0004 [uncultured bacterium]|nr:MAG: hypothetical protein ACD_22C00206G0004 [uncultured bacterium]